MANGKLLGANQPDKLDEHDAWVRVANAVGALGVTPFEAKALFSFALIRQRAEAAISNLGNRFEMDACSAISSGLEAFGRCLLGDIQEDKGSGERLKAGLGRLASRVGGTFQGTGRTYTPKQCVPPRNFSTHGGTTPKKLDVVLDRELTLQLVNLLGEELTAYWHQLGSPNAAERASLARARVRPLWTAGQPVFVGDMHKIMVVPGASAGGGIRI